MIFLSLRDDFINLIDFYPVRYFFQSVDPIKVLNHSTEPLVLQLIIYFIVVHPLPPSL